VQLRRAIPTCWVLEKPAVVLAQGELPPHVVRRDAKLPGLPTPLPLGDELVPRAVPSLVRVVARPGVDAPGVEVVEAQHPGRPETSSVSRSEQPQGGSARELDDALGHGTRPRG